MPAPRRAMRCRHLLLVLRAVRRPPATADMAEADQGHSLSPDFRNYGLSDRHYGGMQRCRGTSRMLLMFAKMRMPV